MECGWWKVEDGKWKVKVEGGRWKMEGGKWNMISGRWCHSLKVVFFVMNDVTAFLLNRIFVMAGVAAFPRQRSGISFK